MAHSISRPARSAAGACALGLLFLAAPQARAAITVKAANAAGPFLFGQTDCANNKAVVFTFDLGTDYTGQAVTLRATDKSDCSTGTNDVVYSYPTSTNSITINVRDFLLRAPAGCGGASTSASPGAAYLCASFPVSSLTSTSTETGQITVNYALQPPGPPVSLAVQQGDSHLKLSWSPASTSDNIASYDVFAVPSGQAISPSETPTQSVSSSTNADVQRTDQGAALQNGASYDLAVRAHDAYGNASALSAIATGSPTQIDDFYNRYRDLGGQAAGGGGCGSTGGGGGLAAAVLLLWALSRRRRALLPLAGALLAATAPARAEPADDDRHLLVALSVDRYDPHVDSEAGLSGTPYHDIFHGRAPLRWQLEGDWEALHPFGSVLVGCAVGFWQNIGHGIVHATGQISDDTALLDILPLTALVSYRFDWLADRYRFLPIIPYAKAGLTAALWTSYSGNGSVSNGTGPAGGRGSGWTYGYSTALGAALALDALSPGISNEGRIDLGLRRTSLFAEYAWTRLDDFHTHHPLILSDRAWRFGFSLEF